MLYILYAYLIMDSQMAIKIGVGISLAVTCLFGYMVLLRPF
jgi:hypothetical protein